MPFDLKITPEKINDLLNQITVIFFFIGLYLTISQPQFYTGKQTLYAQNILPIYSLIIFLNCILILLFKKKEINIIPKTDYLKSIFLFLSATTIFSIFQTSELTLVFFSVLLFFYNLQFSKKTTLSKTLYFSTLIISIIAIAQFMLQKDLNLQILGEPMIGSDIKGIAKLSGEIIRPYGLFQHPNILGAVIVLSSFLNPYTKHNKSFSPQIITLFLTFSLSSLIAYTSKLTKNLKIIIPMIIGAVLVFIFLKSPDFIIERIQQITSLFYNPVQSKPWALQPIHNTFILSAITFGPIHLLSLAWLIFQIYKRHLSYSIAFLILLSFDHYFLTNYQVYPIILLTIYLLGTESNQEITDSTQTKTP